MTKSITPTPTEINSLSDAQRYIYFNRVFISDEQRRNRYNLCKKLTIKEVIGA